MLGISNGGKKDATSCMRNNIQYSLHAPAHVQKRTHLLSIEHFKKHLKQVNWMSMNPFFLGNYILDIYTRQKQKKLKFMYIPTMSKLHSTFFYSLFMQAVFYINYIVCLNCLKKYHKREDPVYV